MSRNLLNNQSQNYGAMDATPDVSFSGFSPTEFYNLCENITTNVYTVNSSWKNLEQAIKSIGTNKDNQGYRDKIHVSQLSTNQIISATSKDLQRLTAVVRRGDKQQKLQVEKLTNDFKDAVERYSMLQKQVANKMKAHLLPVPVYSTEGEGSAETESLLAQQQMVRDLSFERDMLLERESKIKQIEEDILDVNQIMRELGVMIHEQSEAIDTIETAIETAAGNVEQGTSEVMKAAQYQNKYRRKLCILAVIAVVIAAILITVLVTQLKGR